VTRVGVMLGYVHPRPEPARSCAAAGDQPWAPVPLGHAISYQARWRSERSAELVATSRLHEGSLGIQRVEELIASYAAFLVSCGVLTGPQLWKDARTGRFLGRAPG